MLLDHYTRAAWSVPLGMLLLALPAMAAVDVAPDGGDVLALALDPAAPDTVYAGTPAGLYRSTNRGARWELLLARTPGTYGGSHTNAILIDPTAPTTIYASVEGHVMKSIDGGGYWFLADSGIYPDTVYRLAIDPFDHATIYGINTAGAFRTTDGGWNWEDVSAGLGGIHHLPTALVLDPRTPNTVYAAVSQDGVYRSTDAGTTWMRWSSGLPIAPAQIDLAIAPASPPTLYAALRRAGIFKSTDAGATWADSSSGIQNLDLGLVLLDPADPRIVWTAGRLSGDIYRSTDAGASWTELPHAFSDTAVQALAIDPTDGDRLYMASECHGLKLTQDGGLTWNARDDGIHAVKVMALAVASSRPGTMYLAERCRSGGYPLMHATTDGGRTWTLSGNPEPACALAIDPADPLTVFAGAFPILDPEDGISTTTDGGISWTRLLPTTDAATGIAIDPVRPTTVYAATNADGLLKTTDRGATWTQAGPWPYIYTVVLEPGSPGTVYASTDGDGLLRSTDAGQTWGQLTARSLSDLAIDPVRTGTLLAIEGTTIVKSSDGGATWTDVIVLPPTSHPARSIAIDPNSPRRLYAGLTWAGVHRSTDGGATWRPTSVGDSWISHVVVDPTDSSRVLCGSDSASLQLLLVPGDDVVAGPGPGATNPNEVRLFGADGVQLATWTSHGAGSYGTEVAAGDVDGAAIEVLAGPGPGPVLGPQVRAFRDDGAPVAKVSFYAYGTLRYGVKPVTGDIDGDGYDEILTGPGPGSVFGAHVRGFDYDGSALSVTPVNYFAYGTVGFGANVAAGEGDGDGFQEILTGPGPGPGFSPQLRMFDYDADDVRATPVNLNVWSTTRHGCRVAAGDVDADGIEDALVGAGPGPSTDAALRGVDLRGAGTLMPGLDAIVYAGTKYGLHVGAGDMDGDPAREILAAEGASPAAGTHVRAFDYTGSALVALPQTDFESFGTRSFGATVSAGGSGI